MSRAVVLLKVSVVDPTGQDETENPMNRLFWNVGGENIDNSYIFYLQQRTMYPNMVYDWVKIADVTATFNGSGENDITTGHLIAQIGATWTPPAVTYGGSGTFAWQTLFAYKLWEDVSLHANGAELTKTHGYWIGQLAAMKIPAEKTTLYNSVIGESNAAGAAYTTLVGATMTPVTGHADEGATYVEFVGLGPTQDNPLKMKWLGNTHLKIKYKLAPTSSLFDFTSGTTLANLTIPAANTNHLQLWSEVIYLSLYQVNLMQSIMARDGSVQEIWPVSQFSHGGATGETIAAAASTFTHEMNLNYVCSGILVGVRDSTNDITNYTVRLADFTASNMTGAPSTLDMSPIRRVDLKIFNNSVFEAHPSIFDEKVAVLNHCDGGVIPAGMHLIAPGKEVLGDLSVGGTQMTSFTGQQKVVITMRDPLTAASEIHVIGLSQVPFEYVNGTLKRMWSF